MYVDRTAKLLSCRKRSNSRLIKCIFMCENISDQLLIFLKGYKTHTSHTHTSISAVQKTYSQLSHSRKIKDGGALLDTVNMTTRPCVFLLTAPGSCHPNAILPAFITCWTAQHVTGRGLLACHGADQPCVAATWRPVWQLTSITVTLSHSSFSRPHHKHDLSLGKWWTPGQLFKTWTPRLLLRQLHTDTD